MSYKDLYPEFEKRFKEVVNTYLDLTIENIESFGGDTYENESWLAQMIFDDEEFDYVIEDLFDGDEEEAKEAVKEWISETGIAIPDNFKYDNYPYVTVTFKTDINGIWYTEEEIDWDYIEENCELIYYKDNGLPLSDFNYQETSIYYDRDRDEYLKICRAYYPIRFAPCCSLVYRIEDMTDKDWEIIESLEEDNEDTEKE